MQVDLYKASLRGEANRQMEQVRTRKCSISKPERVLSKLDYYFDDETTLRNYKRHIMNLIDTRRKYHSIGGAWCDNLYELETLNIADYCRPYVMIADFSDCLDYVLHRRYGCKISDIRGIDNYSAISRALLNFDFASLDHKATFDALLSASPELRAALMRIAEEADEQDVGAADKAIWVIYRLYCQILSELATVKFYTMMCVCRDKGEMDGDKGVIRSMNYSSVLATVPVKYDKVVTLHHLPDGACVPTHKVEDYQVPFRSYKPFEYVGEVIRRNEFSWKF